MATYMDRRMAADKETRIVGVRVRSPAAAHMLSQCRVMQRLYHGTVLSSDAHSSDRTPSARRSGHSLRIPVAQLMHLTSGRSGATRPACETHASVSHRRRVHPTACVP
jgi:hypothetical protein